MYVRDMVLFCKKRNIKRAIHSALCKSLLAMTLYLIIINGICKIYSTFSDIYYCRIRFSLEISIVIAKESLKAIPSVVTYDSFSKTLKLRIVI